ncbi:hypothetical protein Ccrd_010368, partial [Cynara cardunculus var. scolymus]
MTIQSPRQQFRRLRVFINDRSCNNDAFRRLRVLLLNLEGTILWRLYYLFPPSSTDSGVLIIGNVIYNAQFSLLALNIVFRREDENFRPYHTSGEGHLKPKNSLSDWNCKDPTRLFSLILELRYLPLTKKRVGEVADERLKFEINTIYSRE